MATKANTGFYNGDVIVTKGYSGSLYGAKVLKEIYVDEISEYRWIYQSGDIVDNKFRPSSGGNISITTSKELSEAFSLIWTPDPELSPRKGDILTGKYVSGNTVVLYFEDNDTVYRLNELDQGGSPQSNASLAFYKRKLTDLKVMTTNSFSDRRFSDL